MNSPTFRAAKSKGFTVCRERELTEINAKYTTLKELCHWVHVTCKCHIHSCNYAVAAQHMSIMFLCCLSVCTCVNVSAFVHASRHRRFPTGFLLTSFAFSALTLLVGHQEEPPAVKLDWWRVDVVICLERGADCLRIVHLMPLPSQNPIISCLRLILPFW